MKATVLGPSEGLGDTAVYAIIAVAISIAIAAFLFSPSGVSKYAAVFSFLKQVPGIEVEDVGETNNSNLFSVSVSAATQHFNLSAFVASVGSLGCAVLSTADTDNPSFRTLTVEVPKRTSGVSVRSVIFLGIFFGIIFTMYYQKEEIYKSFPMLNSLKL